MSESEGYAICTAEEDQLYTYIVIISECFYDNWVVSGAFLY